ncbi:serine/arginine-rich splicing factor [Holotrichia oblita]|uniref:Serine/arginine-rich splicing factor n=1 Tax=Holotrichia oblita TaxID=644536 RepID=A0ACB9TLX3_HOLOL|nr:serine/arginine-rich splicing factor [Holotrichia oblita]
MAVGGTRVVQVTNIAPQATKDQMQTLFGYLGKIEDIRLYPTIRDVSCPVQSRICYIKFIDSSTVGIAQHMTNTVFIDRALIVIPIQNGEIPDEYYALEMTKNGTIVPGLCPTEPKLPPNVVNSVSGIGTEQVIITTDPHLQANNLPLYPPLPANYDSVKIEEVRRTVLIHNIDSSISTEDLVNFFAKTGEIKYFRTCTRTSDNTNHMLVEFSEQPSILEALKLNGKELKGKLLKVTHATQAISKPQAKSNEIAQREIEEAMSQAKEAQSLISAAMDPVIDHVAAGVDLDHAQDPDDLVRGTVLGGHHLILEGLDHEIEEDVHVLDIGQDLDLDDLDQERQIQRKERARSRDKDRDRSRERRSRDKERSREKDSDRKDKERESKEKRSDRESSVDEKRASIDKKRSRSTSRGRYRSRSRDRKHGREKKRSRSRGSRRRSPTPKRSRRRSRSRSRDRRKDKKDRKDTKDRSPSHSKVPRNYDEEEKGFDSERDKRKSQESDNQKETESSEKSDNMDISNSP